MIALSHLLELGAGIRNGDETIARFLLTHGLLYELEEILFEDIGLQRRSGFTRHDEYSVLDIHLVLKRLHLCRIRGVQNEKLREAVDLAEGHLEHFGTEAGSAHA